MPKRRKRESRQPVVTCPPSLLLWLSQTSNPMTQSLVAKFVVPHSHHSLDIRTAGSGGLVKRYWYTQNETGKALCESWPTLFVDKQLSQPLAPTRYIRTQLQQPVLWHIDTRDEHTYHWAQVEENGKRIWFIWHNTTAFSDEWYNSFRSYYLTHIFGKRKWKTFHKHQTIRQRQRQAEQENQLGLQPVIVLPYTINWDEYERMRVNGLNKNPQEFISCTSDRVKYVQMWY